MVVERLVLVDDHDPTFVGTAERNKAETEDDVLDDACNCVIDGQVRPYLRPIIRIKRTPNWRPPICGTVTTRPMAFANRYLIRGIGNHRSTNATKGLQVRADSWLFGLVLTPDKPVSFCRMRLRKTGKTNAVDLRKRFSKKSGFWPSPWIMLCRGEPQIIEDEMTAWVDRLERFHRNQA